MLPPLVKWTELWEKDTSDGSEPHGDCRNYAWDGANGRLVLTSDGGVFAREQPRSPGGKWVSLNGDIKEMEYLSAHYDNRDGRFIAGAQDNAAQVLPVHATPESVATGEALALISYYSSIVTIYNSHSV